jgi:adenine deaminase
LKNGAIVSTIAHDSHNLVIIGDNTRDVKMAADKIIEIGGGLVIVKEGKVRGYLPLDIAGIMSNEDLEIVSKGHEELNKIATDELKIFYSTNYTRY